jgi:hypothetical protein
MSRIGSKIIQQWHTDVELQDTPDVEFIRKELL